MFHCNVWLREGNYGKSPFSIAMIYYWRARSTISECLVISWFRYACSVSQFASASHVSVLLVLLATEKNPMISSHVWLVKVKFADDIHILDHFVAGEGLSVCCWIHVCCFKNPSHLLLNPLFLLFESHMLAGFCHVSSHFFVCWSTAVFCSLGLQGFYETDVSWLYINILYINPCKPFVLPLLNLSFMIVKCVPFNHIQTHCEPPWIFANAYASIYIYTYLYTHIHT